MKAPRMRSITAAEVEIRAKAARQFHEVAELVHDEEDEYLRVSAALLPLAGIAASDAICGHRLKERPSGQDHGQAVGVLRTIEEEASRCLRDLLSLKQGAQYGTQAITRPKVEAALRRSARLLEIMERILRS